MTSLYQSVHLSDFTGGLVTNQPSSELQLNQSPEEDNIVLMNKGFKSRFGDSEFNSTAMNSGANMQGLAYYKESGGNEYIVAIAGNKVFRSDNLDGTMDELSLAGGSAPTAGQNNIWTPMVLKNLLMFVGGPSTTPNPPKSWDGSTNTNDYQNLSGSPPSGHLGFLANDRIFIGRTSANQSLLKWCVLANPEDWTGTSSGNQVIYTSDGDHLVGGIPLNNSLVILFKQYSMHYLIMQQAPFPTKIFIQSIGCCGKHAMVNVKGTIYFVTMDKRMKSTNGYIITDYPNSIDDIWDTIPDGRREFIQGVYLPAEEEIHWHISKGSGITVNNYTIVWDLKRKTWLRHTTGFDVNVVIIAQGYKYYAGQYDGKIYRKYDSTRTNDASETSPGSINSTWKTPHITFDNNLLAKAIPYLDISFQIQTDAILKYRYGYDYSLTRSGTLSVVDPGARWGEGTWNVTFIWGGQKSLDRRVFQRGRGNNYQLELYNDEDSQKLDVNGLTLAVHGQGVKEIQAK